MELEPVIGLEIHVQLKTKSKMFCQCENIVTGEEAFDGAQAKPNSAICPICMGYPGTLPAPNGTAIEWTQKAGAALNCELALKSKFDRKHYFYPDLPKGYQISQYDQPFCGEGEVEVVVGGEVEKVGIERIHLEEDAAKNTHPAGANYSLVDYNRAGTPLMEIVTKPDITSPQQAKLFLQELQRTMRSLGVSDADMEKGHMRCDANISLREKGSTELHPKTEIKNVNSFRFVEKALEHEIKRQTKEWEEGAAPTVQSTRGFDSDKGTTYEQRTKEEAADYRYFPEPDIPPFEFSETELAEVRASLPELPSAKKTRFVEQYGLSEEQAQLLVAADDLADFFEAVVSELKQLDNEQANIKPDDLPALVGLAAKVVLRQVREAVGDEAVPTELTGANFAELLVLVHTGAINKVAVDPVLAEMIKTGGDPDHIVQNLGLEQVSDTGDLEAFVSEAIEENPDVVEKIKAGNEGAIQYLMGQVMQKSKGKANPGEVQKLLRDRLT